MAYTDGGLGVAPLVRKAMLPSFDFAALGTLVDVWGLAYTKTMGS